MQWTRVQIGRSVHSKVHLNISLEVLAQTTKSGSRDGKHFSPDSHILSLTYIFSIDCIPNTYLEQCLPATFIYHSVSLIRTSSRVSFRCISRIENIFRKLYLEMRLLRHRSLEESGAPVQTSIREYQQYVHKIECLSDALVE
jgi:hypothetical protein